MIQIQKLIVPEMPGEEDLGLTGMSTLALSSEMQATQAHKGSETFSSVTFHVAMRNTPECLKEDFNKGIYNSFKMKIFYR